MNLGLKKTSRDFLMTFTHVALAVELHVTEEQEMKTLMNGIIRFAALLLALAAISVTTVAQQRIACPTEEHIAIDLKRITAEYDASSFAGTLSSLSVLAARTEASPRKLLEAAVATRKWEVFLKGIADGFNGCAVTRKQQGEAFSQIYPRLKEDAAILEEMRQSISNGQKADVKQIQPVLNSYYASLRRFAQIAGKDMVLDQIEALAQSLPAQNTSGKSQTPEQVKTEIDRILSKFDDLETRYNQAPLPSPRDVSNPLSDVRETLPAKADEAEAAYNKGYELCQRYLFRDAVAHLQKALAAVPLPEFYLALGRAYAELYDLKQAENILRKGLAEAEKGEETDTGAELAAELGSVLLHQGDPDGALGYAQRALKMDEKVHGSDQPEVAVDANNIAQILQAKGDMEGALSYSQRALNIDQTIYGPDRPEFVAVDANNIAQILKAKGDLDGALNYIQRALKINEKVFGPNHPQVAIDTMTLARILQNKGDFGGAITYSQRALKIDERIYGPDHPQVAILCDSIGNILKAKGDLDGAAAFTQRALRILEKAYGASHATTKQAAANLELIKRRQENH